MVEPIPNLDSLTVKRGVLPLVARACALDVALVLGHLWTIFSKDRIIVKHFFYIALFREFYQLFKKKIFHCNSFDSFFSPK